jgi:predicted ATPase
MIEKPTLVGREQELNLLLERWRLAQLGEGQAVLLCAEPGFGKSRTIKALRDRLGQDVGIALQAQCSTYYGNSALYPIIDSIERMLDFQRGESADVRLDKLEALVLARNDLTSRDARLLAEMLTLPVEARYGSLDWTPERRKEETLRAIADLFAAMAKRLPTLMLFEDAHWADPTTMEWLDLLIGSVKELGEAGQDHRGVDLTIRHGPVGP